MNRRTVALVVLVLWLGGVGWMMRRNSAVDPSRRLTEVAVRVQPQSFYYEVSYRGTKIGAASSIIDTLAAGLISEDYFTGRFPAGDSLVTTSARLRARLTRGFRLQAMSLDVARPEQRTTVSGFVQSESTLVTTRAERRDSVKLHLVGLAAPLLTPSLVGVALVLAETPKVGKSERFLVFDPRDASAGSRRISLAAESLFVVVDSAMFTSEEKWKAAHSDTVRAWKLGGDTQGLTVWVDADGRVVSAATATGIVARRTAYELAFERAKLRSR